MLTPEREAEIRKSSYRSDAYYHDACRDLLGEIDRLREANQRLVQAVDVEHAAADRAERAIRDALGVPMFPMDVAVVSMQRILRAGLGDE